jgi:hypothetical protein
MDKEIDKNLHTYTIKYLCTHTNNLEYIHICICSVFVCMCVCVCVCVCVEVNVGIHTAHNVFPITDAG